jgi:hypothetical protein
MSLLSLRNAIRSACPWQGCGKCEFATYLARADKFAARCFHYSGISIAVSVMLIGLQLLPRHRLQNVAIFFENTRQPAMHAFPS